MPSPAERFYGALLRLYPATFRARFGPEMRDVFRRDLAEARRTGRRARLRFWVLLFWDVFRTVPDARRWERQRHLPVPPLPDRPRTFSNRLEVEVDGLKQDIRFAIRTLVRAPAFSAVTVLTLAIGIGATAAVFGVVNAVLLTPLPYGEPDRVVTIHSSWRGFPKTWVSVSEYRAYTSLSRTLGDAALWGNTSVNFTSAENPERVTAAVTTANLVDVLQVDMAEGRFFTEEEALVTESSSSPSIVLSYGAWMRRYAGDPATVGSLVEVNGVAREIVGVLPDGFRLPTDFGTAAIADVYFPRWVDRGMPGDFPEGGGSHGDYVVARLAEGATVAAARRDLERIVDQLHRDFGAYPPTRAFRPLLFAANDDIFGAIRPAILALFGTVAFVLLIACANVANLLLTRGQIRSDEIAVRAALGAGRRRIVRQLLTESLILGLLGAGAGLLLAWGGLEVFKSLNPGNLPRIESLAIDGTVVAFGVAITLITALIFGGLPALSAARGNLQSSLRQRRESGLGRGRWQGLLVSAEMALALVLVMGAGLLVRTFQELSSIDPGFRGDDVLTVAVSLPASTYADAAAAVGFHEEALRRIAALPGVEATAGARILPLASQIGDWGLILEDYAPPPDLPTNGDWQFATPGYFEVMDIPVRRGRTFTSQDDAAGLGVMVVNDAFVRHFWPDGRTDPIGQRVAMNTGAEEPAWMTIVGIVGDVAHNGITAEIKRKFYVPMAQWSLASGGRPTSMSYVVQTAGDASAMIGPVRSVVRELDPTLAVAQAQTVRDIRRAAIAQPRFTVVLMGAFSAIATVLALIGIYGVIAYGVAQRIREIGVRMALGAEPGQVVGHMLRRNGGMVLAGLLVGLAVAFALTRSLESLLYEVSPTDPLTFLLVGVGFTAVATVATWIPARRAARVHPTEALRAD